MGALSEYAAKLREANYIDDFDAAARAAVGMAMGREPRYVTQSQLAAVLDLIETAIREGQP